MTEKGLNKPVYIYYQLDSFCQNSWKYLKSKNIDQLRVNAESAFDYEPA